MNKCDELIFCTLHTEAKTGHNFVKHVQRYRIVQFVQCTVGFQMKMVQYLLHNGDGNGLGDWGKI